MYAPPCSLPHPLTFGPSPFRSIRPYTRERRTLLDSRAVIGTFVPPPTTHCPQVHLCSLTPAQCLSLSARRDIKPDNVLLDSMGHVHITDFNVAIHFSERRLHTSVAGSMAYMAPEVIGHKGYTWSVDWWSLGIVVWELLFHKRPFDGRTAEKMRHSITKDPLRFPSKANELCSAAGQDALRGVSTMPLPGIRSVRVDTDRSSR